MKTLFLLSFGYFESVKDSEAPALLAVMISCVKALVLLSLSLLPNP
jgi:hypothetical protein